MNWSPQFVPGAGDTAVIGGNAADTIRVDGVQSIGSIQLNNPNATLRLLPSGSTGQAVLTVANGFVNAGIIELSSEVGTYVARLTVTSGTLTNATGGLIRVLEGTGGTRTLNANLDNRGKIFVETGVSLIMNGAMHNRSTGVFSGTGTLNLASATLINEGTVAPGASPGILSVSGAFSQTATGMFDMEIGGFTAGTEHDRLAVSGALTLSGAIRAGLTNGFFPKKDDAFNVLTYGSRSGTFATLDNPLPERIAWEVQYGATSAQLVVLNTAPTLADIDDQTVNELTQLSVTAVATDLDLPAQVLTYSLDTAPTGMTINPSSGSITWTPTEAQGPGPFEVTVRVADDGAPSLEHTNSFSVTVNEVNVAPVLAAVPDVAIHAGAPFSVQLSATDTDLPANALNYSLVTGPVGAVVTPTGEVSWMVPVAAGDTVADFTVRVTDDGVAAQSDDESFQVSVVGPVEALGSTLGNGQFEVTFRSVPGLTYRLVSASSLPTNSWSPVPGDFTASGPTTTISVLIGTLPGGAYFQIKLVED